MYVMLTATELHIKAVLH